MGNKTSPTVQVGSQGWPTLTALCLVFFILGLFGNGLVIIITSKFKSKQGGAERYIRHLALADLLLVLTLPLWAAEAFLHDHWPFGWFLCKVSSSVVQLSMYASIFFLTYMSLDRYLAIVRRIPSSQRYSRAAMLGSLGAIWLLSFLLAIPTMLFRTTQTKPDNRTACEVNFSLVVSKPGQENGWRIGLSLFRTVVGFLLPFLSMMICYCFIGRVLNHHFSAVRKEDQRRRHLLKIISILVVVFSICWAPFHITSTIYASIHLQLMSNKTKSLVQLAYRCAIGLAFLNSLLNPFLYAFFDLQFRNHCLQLFHLRKDTVGPTSFQSSQTRNIHAQGSRQRDDVHGQTIVKSLVCPTGLSELALSS